MLFRDPLEVIDGHPHGRGLIIFLAAGLGCALIVLGIDLIESIDSARHSVMPFLVALPLALLPVPLLVALVLMLDRLEPEPPANLAFCFAWGAGIAALLAGILNTAGLLYVTQPALGKGNGQFVSAAIGAPVVEETLKGLVLVWLLWRRRQELDGPTDGIIYAAMVGLGFAMIENVGYYISALVRPTVGGVSLLGATFVFRGVLAPFTHPAFTAMTGIGVAYAATHRRGGWAVAVGLFGAMVLHGLWNGLTSLGLPGFILAYGLLACVLVALIAVLVADRRRMLGLIRRFLPAYQAAGLVSEADLRMLCTLRERRQARRWARRTGGRPLARAMTAYQVAATELALAHERVRRGGSTPGEFEERRRALTGVMAASHKLIWQHRPAEGPADRAKAPATKSQGPQASGGFRGVAPRANTAKAPATKSQGPQASGGFRGVAPPG